jgi:MoxR-like ATPase
MERIKMASHVSLEDVHKKIKVLEEELRKSIVGMDETMQSTLICLFAGGHILLEGVPGLGKTLFFNTLATATSVDFRRISFAADLLPKDVIGIENFDNDTKQVDLVVKGPLHTNILLADELNRARTTSKGSVLEPMEEGQVTTELGGTYKLGDLFMVVATQNPVETEGTFDLGRAEKDRFLMMVRISYPEPEDEVEILYRYGAVRENPVVNSVMTEEEILDARNVILEQVHVDLAAIAKIQKILDMTRPERTEIEEVKKFVETSGGVSPRAGLSIIHSARVLAVLQGNDFIGPENIIPVLLPIFRHRIMLKLGEVEEENIEIRLQEIIDKIVEKVF